MKWINEFKFNVRYGFAGILNGVVGIGSIVALTMLGVDPFLSNIAGFTIGLIFAFLFSRKFVFRSKGRFAAEAIRYITAFVLSYLVNISVLQLCLTRYQLDSLIAQGVAISSYVITMYLASRVFIFRGQKI